MILVNNKEIVITKFPNMESLIDFSQINTSIGDKRPMNVTLIFEDNEDLINLMFVKKHLDQIFKNIDKLLVIRYMPYSRMDRQINNFAFTLKYISEFINYLDFNEVYVHEPHSDVTPALLNNCTYVLTSVRIVEEAMDEISFNKDNDYILFPDAGAQKKYIDMFKGFKTIIGFKHRNLQTGNIESFDVLCDNDLDGAKVLIIDDLCSRGGTFLATANALQDKNAGDIYLAVTHLENNVLTGSLPTSDLIKGVFAMRGGIYTEKVFDKLTMVNV